MNNIPVSDGLRRTFDDASTLHTDVRAILVQSDGKALHLINTIPAKSSDRDDFDPVLNDIFAPDANRSGYALYRLDSQAASGEAEWLCCAYQPDGAKIKEKMQYALTRASLMAGLTERRFLDTIFGSTPRDFIWPTKLRNSRKHDYQNPQLKTAGLPAAEAAGTGSGGARRNFGARAGLANMLRAGEDGHNGNDEHGASDGNTTPPAANSATAPAPAPAAVDAPTEESIAPMPQPKRFNSHSLTNAFKQPGLEEQQETAAKAAQDDEPEDAVAPPSPAATAVEREEHPEPTTSTAAATAESHAIEAPATSSLAAGDSSSLSQPTIPSDTLISTSVAVQEAQEMGQPESELVHRQEEQAEAENPSQPSTPKHHETDVGALSQPTVPSSQYVEAEADETVPAVVAAATTSTPSHTTGAASNGQSETRIGYGTGPGASSGLTRREEEMQELRKVQASQRSTAGNGNGNGNGGPKLGFRWSDAVTEALQDLASTASGTSEWNLVVLSIDMSNELVELDEPPSFVLPADLDRKWGKEPRMAFYRVKEGGVGEGGESKVVMLYYCPAGSGVKARMMYSSNVLITLNHVKAMAGMRVVKKIESSDASDLTHTSILQEVEEILAKEKHIYQGTKLAADQDGAAAGGAAVLSKEELKGSFARPRRPQGRQ